MSEVEWSERDDRVRTGSPWRDLGIGFAIVLLEHVMFGGLLGGGGVLLDQMTGSFDTYVGVFFVWFFGIGLSQLGYVLPTFAIAFLVRRHVAAGVALGALVTFLLNGACFGALCGVFTR